MSRSREVHVVFQIDPETEEFDLDASLIAINGGAPGDLPHLLSDSDWAYDHFQTGGPILEELFGDKVPAAILRGGKFLARGCVVGHKTISWFNGEDYDQWFELHAWRKLS
jgi:hypothetical protein